MHIQQLQPYPSTLFFVIIAFWIWVVLSQEIMLMQCALGGGSAAARAHNAHRQSSTCWRWSPRTSAGLSARQSPPSAPLCPSGQRKRKTSSHVSQHPSERMTVCVVITQSSAAQHGDSCLQMHSNISNWTFCSVMQVQPALWAPLKVELFIQSTVHKCSVCLGCV